MSQIQVLDLIVNLDDFKVTKGDIEIGLPKLSFELFTYFILNPESICTLEEISAAVWGDRVVSNETVVQRITLLRKALNDDPKSPRFIESVRGRGYRLLVKPVRISESSQAPKADSKFTLLFAAFAFLILVSTMLFSTFKSRPSGTDSNQINTVDTTSSTNRLIQRGNYYLSIGQKDNIEHAIPLFEEALLDAPSNLEAMVGLSLALSKSVCRYNHSISRAVRAEKLAQQATLVDTSSSKAQRALAYSFDCQGYLQAALDHYLLAIELDDQNHKAISSAAHLLEVKSKLVKAFSLNQRAKAIQPDNHMVDLQSARILELLNFVPQAKKRYETLFNLYPDNVFINEAYPRLLYSQGQLSKAKTVVEKVLNRDIERIDVFLIYAELIWLLEGKGASITWFEKASKVKDRGSYARSLYLIITDTVTDEVAEAKITAIEKATREGNFWPINYIEATLYASWVLEDQERAMTLLGYATSLGYLNSEYLTISPLFTKLRKHPNFFKLLDNINQKRDQLARKFLAAYPPPE